MQPRGLKLRRREKDAQKSKGLHLKVFYLCALGSSRLTSPVYWGLCDLNAALRLHYSAVTPVRLLTDKPQSYIRALMWTFLYFFSSWQVMDHWCLKTGASLPFKKDFPGITGTPKSISYGLKLVIFFLGCVSYISCLHYITTPIQINYINSVRCFLIHTLIWK